MIDLLLSMTICVLANHLGLIDAIEKFTGRELLVVNCTKCSTFWLSLIVALFNGFSILGSLALAFILAYIAVWLELALGITDKLYEKLFERIYDDIGTEGGSSTTN